MHEEAVPGPLRLAAAIAWRVLVVAAAVVVVALIVAKLRIVAIPLFVALLVATQLMYLVDWLAERGAPRWAGALGALVVGLAVLAGLGAALVGTVIADFDRLDVNFEGGLAEIGDFLVEEFDVPPEDVHEAIADLLGALRDNTSTILGGVFSGASLALELVAGTILAVVMLFFMLKDGRTMWEWTVRLAPAPRQADARAIGDRAWTILGAYFRGTATVALIDAVFIGLALWLIGVPLVLPLAVLTFFAAFIPIVGAVAAGIVAVLVALVSEGLTEAILVGLAVLAVQQIEGNVVAPVLVGRRLSMHPMVVILSVVAGGVVWGVAGAAIAVPLVAVVWGVASYLNALEPEEREGGAPERSPPDDGGDPAPAGADAGS